MLHFTGNEEILACFPANRRNGLLRSRLLSRAASLVALTGAFLLCSTTASASIIYQVLVDTSAFDGTAGYLNFQFNNSGDPNPATAEVSGFAAVGGALGGAPSTFGSVTGALPGTVEFTNDVGFVDYFQELTFGSSFSFYLTLDGPAINAPSGTATSETNFLLYLLGSDGTTALGPTDPDFSSTGYVTIALSGDVTPNAAGPNPIVTFSEVENIVPEPSTWLLSGGALLALVATPRIRRATRRNRA